MPRDARSHLLSMLESTSYLVEEAAKVDFNSYLANQTLRFAFRYSFTMIGESMAQLREHHPDIYAQFESANKIVDFRNFLVHHYWHIDDKEVWSIVITNVPPLRERLLLVLGEKTSSNN